jgi:hypothetical protein
MKMLSYLLAIVCAVVAVTYFAGRLIADVHAGLQCGIDAYSHHARRRRRHGGHYFFVDRPVGEAMNFSPVALAPQLSSSHQTICG